MKKIKTLEFICSLTKCFCYAHAVAAIFFTLIIDTEPHWGRVLIAILYCVIMGGALGILHIEAKDRLAQAIKCERELRIHDAVRKEVRRNYMEADR
jgi:hypothetical protein